MINFIQEVVQNNNPIANVAINQKLLSIQISKGFQLLSEHTKQQLSCSQPEAAHSSESKTSIHEVSELQNTHFLNTVFPQALSLNLSGFQQYLNFFGRVQA